MRERQLNRIECSPPPPPAPYHSFSQTRHRQSVFGTRSATRHVYLCATARAAPRQQPDALRTTLSPLPSQVPKARAEAAEVLSPGRAGRSGTFVILRGPLLQPLLLLPPPLYTLSSAPVFTNQFDDLAQRSKSGKRTGH